LWFLRANGALLKLDISHNRIGSAGLTQKCQIDSKAAMDSLGAALKMAELDLSATNLQATDIFGFTQDIGTSGRLVSLDLSKNALLTKEAGAALGGMLKNNTSLKVLNLSGCLQSSKRTTDESGFASGIESGLAENGVLASLDISNNQHQWSNCFASVRQICDKKSISCAL